MKNKKTITLCASASHYKDVLDIEKMLKKLGFNVVVPKTARAMQKNNNFNVSFYKTWFKDKNDYSKKTELIKIHFDKIIKGDAVLVTNFEKNGIEGYIGGSVLMEMVIAFHYKKPIFILNNISEDLSIKEEVFGLNPIFISNDLILIKKALA